MGYELIAGDCLEVMASMAEKSVDLVFGSPPYRLARTYGINFSLADQAWVDWMVEVYRSATRVCRGLVAFVVEGQTCHYRWTAEPALLMADLHRAGFNLRRPVIYHRVGIPGSGGPDWLRADTEWIVCVAPPGKLPWSDNTAMGHPPKWAPGGEMSHRLSDGTRRNAWGGGEKSGQCRQRDGTRKKSSPCNAITHTKKRANGVEEQVYVPPKISNPGNVIHCKAGGGNMGSALCHENEAPFPERLAEFFVRTWCPPAGRVLDCFCGSGTTVAVAHRLGRHGIGIDLRPEMIELSRRRCANETPLLLPM
jgi:DNA methylase